MSDLVRVALTTIRDRRGDVRRAPHALEIACYYARYILIPGTTFILHSGTESDSRLAERFNVPLEQIAAKREDIALRGLGAAA